MAMMNKATATPSTPDTLFLGDRLLVGYGTVEPVLKMGRLPSRE